MQISQAKSILLQQQSEWTKVLGETEERQSYINYGIILTVLAHIAMFIGSAFISSALHFMGAYGYGAGYFAVYEGIELVLAIATLYIIPPVLAAIAPSFGGQNNSLNALKLFVFAMTPAWIGSMLGILPVIGWLGAIAGSIYAIILFWQHVDEAMSVPADKKVIYVIASIVCIGVIMWVISAVAMGIAAGMFVHNVIGPHVF
jgi:hypothetical protein